MSVAAERTAAVAVDVTFLRMDRRPAGPPPPLPLGVRVTQATRCTTAFYRYLYDTVGHDYVWWLRRTLTEAELSRILADSGVTIHVLYKDGEPAGFYELDRRNRPLVNLSYFGLMPHAIGAGLGRAFLGHAVDEAWSQGTRALTVNTCTADHPRALPNYLAAGFGRLRTVREVWNVPLHLGLPIPSRLRIG
ncbi:GNAT family N-acetyltransferase [Belnapia sp. F-4-1]|uniref:GNAT family N-acetyltransferase n=1 Tax=Belnapia sp. F-4-1 TaxID=1545443 RepID=UPI0005BDBCFA|nr:GNAT family N-acetyltransferase [Belnapia sp. F-4-1]